MHGRGSRTQNAEGRIARVKISAPRTACLRQGVKYLQGFLGGFNVTFWHRNSFESILRLAGAVDTTPP